MPPLTVFDRLALHPFVGDLPTNWLQKLASFGRPTLRHPGHRLFHEGAPANTFWLLTSGAIALDFQVPGRGSIVIERLESGAPVGWSWLLPPYRWSVGAVVADECHAIEFDAPQVRRLMAEDADLGRELAMRFVGVLADRLTASRVRLVELYAYPAGPEQAERPVT